MYVRCMKAQTIQATRPERWTPKALATAAQRPHEAKVGEAIACRVEAERIGFAGYGMMIAEIGLPPGAEVDRESLEEAKQTGVDGYEVRPDRVVFYLWPSAGGSNFQFIFRPRFGISAMSAPSVLYDYYNPEANATVLPLRFNVQ
jgi:hypothetical protein